jgi:hypothetical protein
VTREVLCLVLGFLAGVIVTVILAAAILMPAALERALDDGGDDE